MAEYVYTISDLETGEILVEGLCSKCCEFLGCTSTQLSALAVTPYEYKSKTKYSRYKVERNCEGTPRRGGTRLIDTFCVDCGVKLEQVATSRKRCEECARKRNRRKKTEHMRKVRQSQVHSGEPKPPKDYCEGCIYYQGEYEVTKCCNYLFETGKRRPCPPGKGCTVKVRRKSKGAK